MTLYFIVSAYLCFGETCCLNLQDSNLEMEVACVSKTLVSIDKMVWWYNPGYHT